jgi:hypothetical protein
MYVLVLKINIFYVSGVPKGIYPQLSIDKACMDPQWGTAILLWCLWQMLPAQWRGQTQARSSLQQRATRRIEAIWLPLLWSFLHSAFCTVQSSEGASWIKGSCVPFVWEAFTERSGLLRHYKTHTGELHKNALVISLLLFTLMQKM